GRPPALRPGFDLPPGRFCSLPPDFWDDRPTAALARHGRKLAVDARLLGSDLHDRRGDAARPAVLRVLVRAVFGLLDCFRGGRATGEFVPAGRWHEQRRPPALLARQRG